MNLYEDKNITKLVATTIELFEKTFESDYVNTKENYDSFKELRSRISDNYDDYLSDIGLVSSLINSNLFDDIKKRLNISDLETHSWISKRGVEFANKFSHFKGEDWLSYNEKNNFSDFEEVLYKFTLVKLDAEVLEIEL